MRERTPDKEQPAANRTRTFISYSREDAAFVGRLEEALEIGDVDVLRDTGDILPSEAWWNKIVDLIAQSDSVVFVVSPASLASSVVQREIDTVLGLNKRLIPIVCRPIDGIAVPEALSQLNYVYFTSDADFLKQVRVLLTTLRTDIEWIRRHTEIGLAARRWEQAPPSQAAELLLRGELLKQAETWLTSRPREAPEPTGLQLEFIKASRRASRSTERKWLLGSVAVTVMALALSGVAVWQAMVAGSESRKAQIAQREAEVAQRLAEENAQKAKAGEEQVRQALVRVQQSEKSASDERDRALLTQSRFLASTANTLLARSNATSAALLALEALTGSRDSTRAPEAQVALYGAVYRLREQAAVAGELQPGSCEQGRPAVVTEQTDNGMLVRALGGETVHIPQHGLTLLTRNHQRLIVGSEDDQQVTVWDLRTQSVLHRLASEGRPVDLEATPDGARILVVSEKDKVRAITVWDSSGEGPPRKVLVQQAPLEGSMSLTPDGKAIVWRTFQKSVQLIEVDSGRTTRHIELSPKNSDVAISRTGRMLAVSSGDNAIEIVDTLTGVTRRRIELTETPDIATLVFSPDDSRILVSFWRRRVAELWQTTGSAEPVRLASSGDLNYPEPSMTDHHIAGDLGEGKTGVWSLTGELLATIPAPSDWDREWDPASATIHPDRQRMAVAHANGLVEVRSLKGTVTASWASEIKNPRTVRHKMAFCGNGEHLAVEVNDDGSRSVHLLDLSDPPLATRISSIDVLGLDSLDSTLLIAVPGGLESRAAPQGPPVRTYAGPAGSRFDFAVISPDRTRIAAAHMNGGFVAVWELETGRLLSSFQAHDKPIRDLAFGPGARQLITASQDNTAAVWNAQTGALQRRLTGHDKYVHRAAISPSGTLALTVSGDGTVRLWPLEGPERQRVLYSEQLSDFEKQRPEGTSMYGARFSPDGTEIMLSGRSRLTFMKAHWAADGERSIRIERDAVISIDRQGKRMALLFPFDNMVELWTPGEQRGRHVLYARNSAVTSGSMTTAAGLPGDVASFSHDGKRLLSLFSDSPPQLWDVERGELVANLEMFYDRYGASPSEVHWSEDGRRVLVFDPSRGAETRRDIKSAFVFDLFPTLDELIAYARKSVPRCLTPTERKRYFLDPEPSQWCRDMKKWPYDN